MKAFDPISLLFVKTHKCVHTFVGTQWTDNTDLLNCKAHFLHYGRA